MVTKVQLLTSAMASEQEELLPGTGAAIYEQLCEGKKEFRF